MLCTKCGYELDENATFCTQCGTNLNEEVPFTEQPQAPEQAETFEQTHYEEQNQADYQYAQFDQPQPEYQYAQYEQQATPSFQPPQEDNSKALAIASLVIGILTSFVSGTIIMPGIGLALGIMSYKKTKSAGLPNEFAFAGIITNAIRLVVSITAIITAILIFILYFVFIFLMMFMSGTMSI